MLNIEDVFLNLMELFLLIGVGCGAVRLNLLPASASKLFTALLMNITLPATIFTSLARPYDPAFFSSGVLIAALGTGFYLLYGAVCLLLVRIFRIPAGRQGVWVLGCVFSNNGYMGFPIALALFGEEGLVLAVLLGIPFNLLSYTSGARLVSMDRAAAGGAPPLSWRALLLTVVNGSTLLGLLFFAAQWPVPAVLSAPLTYLSNVTTPLSMLIIGMSLSGGDLLTPLRDWSVLSGCGVRLLLLPLLTLGLVKLLPLDAPLVVGVLVVIRAMPSAALTSLLAEAYGGDTEFAAQLVFLSSLLCLVTIPLISLLL